MLTTQAPRWGYNLQFQGISALSSKCKRRYNSYYFGETLLLRTVYTVYYALYLTNRRQQRFGVFVMKLPLIAATVVAYTVLALAWIVYVGLTPPGALF